MSGRDTLIGSTPRRLLSRYGVELHGRAVSADGTTIRFEDESQVDVAGIVWSTGFRVDHSWIDAPVFEDAGRVLHQRGVTEAPGLYFLGLSWQHTRGSALLGWVKDDAEYIAKKVGSFRPSAASQRAEPTTNGDTGAAAPAADALTSN